MKSRTKGPTSTGPWLAITAVIVGTLVVYAALRGVPLALHRRAVAAAIPVYRKSLETDRDRLSDAIEKYRARFGVYPPQHGTNPALRAVSNSLYYELIGTRWNSNAHAFGLPTTKATVGPAEILKAFGLESFSNSLPFPDWPTNYLDGQGFTGAGEGEVLLLLSGVPEGVPYDIADAFHVTPWRFVSDPAEHKPGRFDLWTEVEVLGQRFEVRNW